MLSALRLQVLPLAILLVACLSGVAAAQVTAGSITQLEGTATVTRGGHSMPAKLALAIDVGDALATAGHSSLTVTLKDGSRLMLSESSSFVLDRATFGLKQVSIVDLLRGHLRSVVKFVARRLATPVFEVHTPNAVAAVRGTDFETAFIEGKPCPGFPRCLRYTDVGVYKGVVEVRNPTSREPTRVRVTAGYETTVPCELPPASPGPLGMGDITAPAYR
jgi:ferric-dicitrate binding protein FerR (iron transport regulator)